MRILFVFGLAIAVYYSWTASSSLSTKSFRFRLTVTVDHGGTQKAASSILEAQVPSSHGGKRNPFSVYGKVRGVAPVIDLGTDGTLIAALLVGDGGSTGKPSNGEAAPSNVYRIPFVFMDERMRFIGHGPFTVAPHYYPQFIWLPYGASHPDAARPLLPSEFRQHIGRNVKLVSVKVEPADEPPIEKIDPPPRWLEVLREGYVNRKGSMQSEIRQNASGRSKHYYYYKYEFGFRRTAVETASMGSLQALSRFYRDNK